MGTLEATVMRDCALTVGTYYKVKKFGAGRIPKCFHILLGIPELLVPR